MKNIGIVSYNIHCNFTNYGSALQSWALSKAIEKVTDDCRAVLIDYCPLALKDKNPLNPIENMWDTDSELRRMCESNLSAIKENYYKFDKFYTNKFNRTKKEYDHNNFNEIIEDENISGFVCGSDTIFCVDEFGIDDGFFANYDCMKNGYSVSYAASFGDCTFNDEIYKKIDERLKNFKFIGLRETTMLSYIEKKVSVPVKRVIDPTLLLTQKDYEEIIDKNKESEPYLLLYSRRKNDTMDSFAKTKAKEMNLNVIEISISNANADIHKIFYEAGAEEFLSLVKNASYIVTNSYHGMIFSIQFRKEFVIFSREQCNTKISELLEMSGLSDRLLKDGNESFKDIDYDKVHSIIERERKESLEFLKMELNSCK